MVGPKWQMGWAVPRGQPWALDVGGHRGFGKDEDMSAHG